MEHLLLKMARQLDSLDEASLLALWEKYATIVSRFEPTKRWEEAALVFSLIQAKHLKNQLFNYSWSAQVRPVHGEESVPTSTFTLERQGRHYAPQERQVEPTPQKKAKIVAFRPKKTAAPSNASTASSISEPSSTKSPE